MKYKDKVFMSVYDSFIELQDFTERCSDIIKIINIQKIKGRFYIYYNSVIEK